MNDRDGGWWTHFFFSLGPRGKAGPRGPLLKGEGMISFFVPGVPVPKGSARSFWNKTAHKVVTMQTNAERQKPWSSLISFKAQEVGLKARSGACSLGLAFCMPRPKAHFAACGKIKESAPIAHIKKPDIDKLIRCVLDALTGIAYVDDSQVARIETLKRYANLGEDIGCTIEVEYETKEAL